MAPLWCVLNASRSQKMEFVQSGGLLPEIDKKNKS